MTFPRILFVNQSSEIGGGELALFDFVRDLPGAHVAVFAPGPFLDLLQDAGVSASVLDGGGILSIRRDAGLAAGFGKMVCLPGLTIRLARLARRYDLVYANSQKAFIASAPAAWLARRPFVWHLHDILSPDHFSPLLRRLTVTFANRFARRVIANSRATQAAFVSQGGRTPVSVVHNGIDPAAFGDGPDSAGRARLALAIGSGTAPIVGVFGRLAPWKGQDVAIGAIATLPHHHLVLVGGALFGEQTYERRLNGLVADMGLEDRVHFLGFQRNVPALMRSVDVVVHSSVSAEPFGRVIVEGMMAGVPVVATAAGGALEILDDADTGLLVPPGDATILAQVLEQLSREPARAAEIAIRGRTHARGTFALAASVDRLRSIVLQVVGDPKRSA